MCRVIILALTSVGSWAEAVAFPTAVLPTSALADCLNEVLACPVGVKLELFCLKETLAGPKTELFCLKEVLAGPESELCCLNVLVDPLYCLKDLLVGSAWWTVGICLN